MMFAKKNIFIVGDIVISESTHDESVLSVPASAVDENVFVRTVSGRMNTNLL